MEQMATLEAALKRAIQLEFQLEDVELATEPLPSRQERHYLLFYEAAEGGAGVLRQLVDYPSAWPTVARRALELCHFDPATGNDLEKAPHAEERCQAACYDCLLSYYNQGDHEHLDRHLGRDLLLQLSQADVESSPVELPRADHLAELKRLCDSNLERHWLEFLEENLLRLPTCAQRTFTDFGTRPDFAYLGANPTFIYVDGPPHDYPERQGRDATQTARLEHDGVIVIRFHHQDDWTKIVSRHPSIFGELK
jgi:very-short-patch-repair endonuclease